MSNLQDHSPKRWHSPSKEFESSSMYRQAGFGLNYAGLKDPSNDIANELATNIVKTNSANYQIMLSKSTEAPEDRSHDNTFEDQLQEISQNIAEIEKLRNNLEKIKQNSMTLKFKIQFLESLQSKLNDRNKKVTEITQKLRDQLLKAENLIEFEALMEILKSRTGSKQELLPESIKEIPQNTQVQDREEKRREEIRNHEQKLALLKHNRNSLVIDYEVLTEELYDLKDTTQKKAGILAQCDKYAEDLKNKISQLSFMGLTTPKNPRLHMRTLSNDIKTQKQLADSNARKFVFKDDSIRFDLDSSRLNTSKINSTVMEDVGNSIKSFLSTNFFKRDRSKNQSSINSTRIIPPELLSSNSLPKSSLNNL